MAETKFYVEHPADEYGNTSIRRVVIEAEPVQVPGGRVELEVKAPAEVAESWPVLYPDIYNWRETEGPARILTKEEWAEIVGWKGYQRG